MVAISSAESNLFGDFGANDGTPLLMVNVPSLVRNSLSILGR